MTKSEQAGLAQSPFIFKLLYKTGQQSCYGKSEQAGLDLSLSCPKHPTRLVNNPVKTKVDMLGSLRPFHVQITPYTTGKQSC